MLKVNDASDLKEEYRIFFMVKGHLEANPQTVMSCAESYFKRLWADGANGAPLSDYSEQFERAWEEKYGHFKNSAT